MKRLTYTKQTSLVLHIEDFLNAGLQQEDMMEEIKKIKGIWLVQKYPINSNIKVHIQSNNDNFIQNILYHIEFELNTMLNIYNLFKKPVNLK